MFLAVSHAFSVGIMAVYADSFSVAYDLSSNQSSRAVVAQSVSKSNITAGSYGNFSSNVFQKAKDMFEAHGTTNQRWILIFYYGKSFAVDCDSIDILQSGLVFWMNYASYKKNQQ